MKAITRKVLVTIVALAVTVTLAYAGIRNDNKVSRDEVYNHPALDETAYGTNQNPMLMIF